MSKRIPKKTRAEAAFDAEAKKLRENGFMAMTPQARTRRRKVALALAAEIDAAAAAAAKKGGAK